MIRKFKFIAKKRDGKWVAYHNVTTPKSMAKFLEVNGFTHAKILENGKIVGYWNRRFGLFKD